MAWQCRGASRCGRGVVFAWLWPACENYFFRLNVELLVFFQTECGSYLSCLRKLLALFHAKCESYFLVSD